MFVITFDKFGLQTAARKYIFKGKKSRRYARRTYSHIDLPVEMRNVKVFKYVIKYTNNYKVPS